MSFLHGVASGDPRLQGEWWCVDTDDRTLGRVALGKVFEVPRGRAALLESD